MNKKNIIIGFLIVCVFFLHFSGRSYFRRRNAVKVVQAVLTYWENNDLTMAIPYWEKELDSPPVYDLISYEIGKKEFDKKNNMYHAQIAATLYFPPDNLFPSQKEWCFELNKTRYGWKIISFRLWETGKAE